jgi:hypothetical protein
MQPDLHKTQRTPRSQRPVVLTEISDLLSDIKAFSKPNDLL